MKSKISLMSCWLLLTLGMSAVTLEKKNYQLHWKEIAVWSVGQQSIKMVDFEGALHRSGAYLPLFVNRMRADPTMNYRATILNPVYIPLTFDERALLKEQRFPLDPVIKELRTSSRNDYFVDFTICPFICRDGDVLKLSSFDLQIDAEPSPMKQKKANALTFSTGSVLAQGKFVKIRVADTGIYKLTYEDLKSMGVDPANARIFGYGGAVLDPVLSSSKPDDLPELAVWMEKGSDGVFNAGDYLLFYGQGPVQRMLDDVTHLYTHTLNTYSKYGYYFVTSDAGVGKKISEKAEDIPTEAVVMDADQYVDYRLFKKELRNLYSSGKVFYGEAFESVSSYDFAPKFVNPVPGTNTSCRISVATNLDGKYSDSNFFTLVTGSRQDTIYMDSMISPESVADTTVFFPYPQGADFTPLLKYSKKISGIVGYLDFMELNARCSLKMNGSVMSFQNVDHLNSEIYHRYQLADATSAIQIWDITNPVDIVKLPTQWSNNRLTFTAYAGADRRFLAIDPSASSAFLKPEVVSVVPNQNLHAISSADFVIITATPFLEEAERLAEVHRQKDNMAVTVVTDEQVYNEFSSGTPDATAYRWLLRMLYDKANGDASRQPRYLLLFGKGSYDNRQIFNNSGDNLLLTYQSEESSNILTTYSTDDYFGLITGGKGADPQTELMDVGVGRIPVNTLSQAKIVVDKIIDYMSNDKLGAWKNQLCFIGDDGGNGDRTIHVSEADAVAEAVKRNYKSYQVNKVYLDAYKQEVSASGESYPLAKTKVMNLLQSGLFLINYAGHANANTLSGEGIVTSNDIVKLSNRNLPVWVAAACDFSHYDGSDLSGGARVLIQPDGGGIASFAATREVFATENYQLNDLFCKALFKKQSGGKEARMGDIVMQAKNSIPTSPRNRLCYIYFGDPALRLNYPTDYQVLTQTINGVAASLTDTCKALAQITVTGIVADDKNEVVPNFNGVMTVTVYDKEVKLNTLDNHNEHTTYTFADRPNVLFSGNVMVKKGAFSFSFMVPKDIKFNYGTGRINYYAQDEVLKKEAQGYSENFLVGGMTSQIGEDNEGPEIELFLNSEKFADGDKVNETPLFIANLKDENGINTVGTGIGHDLLLTIDKDVYQSYVMNDYFLYNVDTYKEGKVNFKMPQLTEGQHTLSFKAWDLLNNSTVKSIRFEVVNGLTPQILSITNYPNPAHDKTIFIVKHNRPGEMLTLELEVFNLNGQKVWSQTQHSSDPIEWNLKGNNGASIRTGVYVYRVWLRTNNSNSCSGTHKLIIIE